MSNSILAAFIEQTYGSKKNAHQADLKADQSIIISKELSKNFEKKAILELSKNQAIKSAMNIPTKLKDGELNSKTVSRKNFANSDHSLEMDRKNTLREKYLNEKYKDNLENKPTLIDFEELKISDVNDFLK